MEIRKNFNHEPTDGLVCMSPSRTQQQFKNECDVNNILRNYVNTGVLTHVNNAEPMFGDFSQVPSDFGEALALIDRATEEFNALPSEVRAKFDNKPLNLVQFLQDESNREEAEKLGLVNKRVVESSKDNDSGVSD